MELPDPLENGRRLLFKIAPVVKTDLFSHAFLLSDSSKKQVGGRCRCHCAKNLIPQEEKSVNPNGLSLAQSFQHQFEIVEEAVADDAVRRPGRISTLGTLLE